MGRKIKFNFDGITLESEIIKVDRSKLYGSVNKIVKDSDNEECIISDLYEGSLILPRGSISQILDKTCTQQNKTTRKKGNPKSTLRAERREFSFSYSHSNVIRTVNGGSGGSSS